MVANRGIHTHAIDHAAIGLELGEEPIVILVARVAHWDAEKLLACVNVVSRGQDEAHASTRRVEYLDAGRTIRGRPRADGIAPRRVNMLQVAVVTSFISPLELTLKQNAPHATRADLWLIAGR